MVFPGFPSLPKAIRHGGLILLGALMGGNCSPTYAASCGDLFRFGLERAGFFRPSSLRENPQAWVPEELLRLAQSDPEIFKAEIERIFAQMEKLQARAEDAIRHPLTKLYNRRARDEWGQKIFEIAQQKEYSVAILSIDSNKFKQINDRLSHARGDQHLTDLAALLYWVVVKSVTRETDFVFHGGGDEFHIVLQGADLSGANQVAKRITEAVAQAPFLADISQRILRATQGEDPVSTGHRRALEQALGPQWREVVEANYVGTLTVGVAARAKNSERWESFEETLMRADEDLELKKTLRNKEEGLR